MITMENISIGLDIATAGTFVGALKWMFNLVREVERKKVDAIHFKQWTDDHNKNFDQWVENHNKIFDKWIEDHKVDHSVFEKMLGSIDKKIDHNRESMHELKSHITAVCLINQELKDVILGSKKN
jgi:hypothetical protein